MKVTGKAGKSLFVFLCVILSIAFVYLASANVPLMYKASLEFGIASADQKTKPDFLSEKKLLLSDEILLQVMRELNMLPVPTSRFRSFDLGQAKAPPADHKTKSKLAEFRKNFSVDIEESTSSLKVAYTGVDAIKTRKTLEVLFEKYRNLRDNSVSSNFDEQSLAIDREIAEKREIFLQSQQQILNLLEGKRNSSDVLLGEKTAADARIAALKLRYGPKHPVLIEAIKRREALELKGQPQDNEQLSQLKKKLETDFKILDDAMRKSVVVEQEKTSSPAAIEILPMGDVVVINSAKYIFYKMGVAALLAFMLSVLYLNIRSRYHSSFEDSVDVKSAFGFDAMAVIPGLEESTSEFPMPSGQTAEKLKVLRQELKLHSNANPVKLVALTSTSKKEGVTPLVAGLGRLAARAGENVIIVDTNLRAPALQRGLPQSSSRNLVDYLSGQARIEDIIYKNDISGVHVIYATAVPNTALDLVSSEKMKTLLYSLREVYDLVLLEAAPAEMGPDARILGLISDHVLFCLKSEKTNRKQALTVLSGFDKDKISVVLIQN